MANPRLSGPALTRALSRSPRPARNPLPPADGGLAGGRAAADRPALQPRIVLLGVGSELRCDDAAGLLVARRMARRRLPGVHTLVGGTAPENLTGEIRRLAPVHLLIVDSADIGEAPGAVRLIHHREIGATCFGTHGLPLGVLAEYLRREVGCGVTVIGIQPRSLEFGTGLSAEVEQAVRRTVRTLAACLRAWTAACGSA